MNLKWTQVLNDWQKSEEHQWEPLYTQRGYDSWWEWRESYMKELQLADRDWTQEVRDDAHAYVTQLHVGGYRGWQQYRPENIHAATFEQVTKTVNEEERNYTGELRVDVRTNEKIMNLIGKLHDTTILVLKSGDFEVLLDGHHRCAAIAIESTDGPRSNFNLTVRTCHFKENELDLLKTFAKDRHIVIQKKHD